MERGGFLLVWVNKVNALLLTHDEDEQPSDHGAFVFGALRFVAKFDAGHGHEDHPHGGKTQDGSRDHQCARRLDVG